MDMEHIITASYSALENGGYPLKEICFSDLFIGLLLSVRLRYYVVNYKTERGIDYVYKIEK